ERGRRGAADPRLRPAGLGLRRTGCRRRAGPRADPCDGARPGERARIGPARAAPWLSAPDRPARRGPEAQLAPGLRRAARRAQRSGPAAARDADRPGPPVRRRGARRRPEAPTTALHQARLRPQATDAPAPARGDDRTGTAPSRSALARSAG